MDPFLDLIRLLRPRATLLGGGLEAAGRWALSFQKRDDLLFCWIEQGECQFMRPGCAPVPVQKGDFLLIRTSTSFILASDPTSEPVDSETAVSAAKSHRLRLGAGTDYPVILHAGKFLFNTANEDLLMRQIPPLIHLSQKDAASDRVRALLAMNQMESQFPGPASEFIIVRLVELLFIEILRSKTSEFDQAPSGLLAGLADPLTARALSAIHQDVAHEWTVANLAKLCAVSRSSFATRFRSIIGMGPIEYVQNWRMAIAKDALQSGTRSIKEIASAVGFQSQSAFSTAFSRVAGCSPTQFAAARVTGKSVGVR